jgi:putative transport protein
MELDILSILKNHPELTLFAVIGIGYLFGKIGARGITLGPSIGVLAVGLIFGHFGLTISPIVGTLGFIFFIYSVGYQAGPSFFSTFRHDGVRYIQIGVVIAATAFLTALGAAKFCRFDPGYAAGVLAGALTSTPTLAAAQDAVSSGLAHIPAGFSADALQGNIAVGYAVTYMFGLIGLIVFLQLLPKFMKIDLPREAEAAAAEMDSGGTDADDEMRLGRKGLPTTRSYLVEVEDTIGKSLLDLMFLQVTGSVISRLVRNGEDIELGPETTLEKKDKVLVLGYNENHVKASAILGREIHDTELEQTPFETHSIMVTNNKVDRKTLRDTGVTNKFACVAHKVRRAGVELPVSLDMEIRKDDYIVVSGAKNNIEQLVKHLGQAEKPIHETDLLTFAFGIVGGLFLGYCTVKIGNLPVGIGSAGGLLTVGLLIGWARTFHPIFGRVPHAARFILMELGLLLFLAGVGIRAGSGLIEGLRSSGVALFLSGAVVTILPPLLGVLFGKIVLKMNPAILFGAITGGLTSTPALGVITKQAKSDIPAMGYVGVYAFANIILTVAGQLMMII